MTVQVNLHGRDLNDLFLKVNPSISFLRFPSDLHPLTLSLSPTRPCHKSVHGSTGLVLPEPEALPPGQKPLWGGA
jgi:hypothetical protein